MDIFHPNEMDCGDHPTPDKRCQGGTLEGEKRKDEKKRDQGKEWQLITDYGVADFDHHPS